MNKSDFINKWSLSGNERERIIRDEFIKDIDNLIKIIKLESEATPPKPVTKSLLHKAGKLATIARLVTYANTKNISQRIKDMEIVLDEYDNAVAVIINSR